MKKLVVTLAWLSFIPALASAQNADHPPRWQAYALVGADVTRLGDLTAGFGGEGYVFKGWAVGAEVGAWA